MIQHFLPLTGHPPFAWQERLFEGLREGRIHRGCDIPTGLGKTSVLAVWLLALAEQATRSSPALTLPRRLAYIVDRRVVVDQATEEAQKLRNRLEEALAAGTEDPLHALAETLRGLGVAAGGPPFALSTLRGALADNRQWSRDPARPAIIIGTVDLIGSRLLFAGYGGLGRHGKSQHAALLGQDTLVVLDEAHLSPAFARTLLAAGEQAKRGKVWRPFRTLLLSATQPRLPGRAATGPEEFPGDVVRLEPEDLENDPEVARRVRAPKTLRFVDPLPAGSGPKPVPDALARQMAAEAVALAGANGAVVIFANTVRLVKEVDDALRSLHGVKEGERVVITGEIRGHERDTRFSTNPEHREAADPVFIRFCQRRPDRAQGLRPVFLIATAAAEVGVNFDADHAVCDLAPLERMAQRLGRVNRFGDGDTAEMRVVLPLPAAEIPARSAELTRLDLTLSTQEGADRGRTEKRIEELTRVLSRHATRTFRLLTRLPTVAGAADAYSVSPESLGPLLRHRFAPRTFSPASAPPPLDEARLDDWSLTSLLPDDFPRPRPAYWLRGITPDETVTTSLAWREDLAFAVSDTDAKTMAETLRLRPRELAAVATHRAAELFLKLAKGRPAEAVARTFLAVLSPAGEWTGYGLEEFLDQFKRFAAGKETIDPKELMRAIAGATVLLPVNFGGLDLKTGLPNRDADGPVSDVADESSARFPRFLLREHHLGRWHAHAIPVVTGTLPIASGDSPEEVCDRLPKLAGQKLKFIHLSGPKLPEPEEGEVPVEPDPAAPPGPPRVVYFAVVSADPETPDADDLASLRGKIVLLTDHLSEAEAVARRIVERLGLPASLAGAVVQAAAWHDLGKDRKNWQRAIGNPDPGKPWAKSGQSYFNRQLSQGYRHEFGSMLEAAERLSADHPERDLILHLIAAHHGHGRPGFNAMAYDPAALRQDCEEAAREAELRFAKLQRDFGWWTLAYLEALVKCADGLASGGSEEDAPPMTSPTAAAPAAPQQLALLN